MRRHLALVLVLAVGTLAACAGPRLVGRASTAHLPAPVVRRVEVPAIRTEGVAWPHRPVDEPLCET